ncbi:hypothetical protein BCU68_00985 [Vibrio sp. 10N.286.49.B3]|uniref:hypothetical protein n=1 Tax=Vibrio sp. 10N.286.49.B3 TaxID=1880855 RepID=UPI000C8267D6|nr:hypothetical protein [Vibrio sp. 10N.286.49.B3]PMH46895.1 hypothetical protein BCU68_00985 [Vibrio sp. 10N.286.49.B3]
MLKQEGICDWCKQHNYVMRHDYLDGLFHHSCQNCNECATHDVRQFNNEEQEERDKEKLKQAS